MSERTLRLSIRVRPGSARAGVGGQYARALLVRVHERAVDNKATEAALAAVAEALGVRRGDITLVTGATSRHKVIEVRADDEAAVRQRLADLLAQP